MRIGESSTAVPLGTLPPTAAAVRGLLASQRRTQQELAVVLGITQSAASRRLTGRTEFSAAEILQIAEWLGVPASRVLGEPLDAAKGA
jgi:transcriptional regulator with XRE-family HTH domain